MKKLLITGWVPEAFLEPFREKFEMTMPAQEKLYFSHEEVAALLPESDALFTLMAFPVRPPLLERAERLRAVANYGVGYDNIDVAACTARGIYVLNTPTTVTEPTAELTVALMMAITKGIARYDRNLRQSRRMDVPLFYDRDIFLMGKTLGILGLGRIGQAVARKAQGLGMEILYYDPFRRSPEEEQAWNVRYGTLEEVLANADVVTCHMPYTAENHHLMNLEAFRRMKRTAYFINAARGPIMCEADLATALRTGLLRGAATDVFEREPEVSAQLAELDNVVITPHIGSNVMEARKNMVDEALNGVFAVLSGDRCHNVVNRELFGAQQ